MKSPVLHYYEPRFGNWSASLDFFQFFRTPHKFQFLDPAKVDTFSNMTKRELPFPPAFPFLSEFDCLIFFLRHPYSPTIDELSKDSLRYYQALLLLNSPAPEVLFSDGYHWRDILAPNIDRTAGVVSVSTAPYLEYTRPFFDFELVPIIKDGFCYRINMQPHLVLRSRKMRAINSPFSVRESRYDFSFIFFFTRFTY